MMSKSRLSVNWLLPTLPPHPIVRRSPPAINHHPHLPSCFLSPFCLFRSFLSRSFVPNGKRKQTAFLSSQAKAKAEQRRRPNLLTTPRTTSQPPTITHTHTRGTLRSYPALSFPFFSSLFFFFFSPSFPFLSFRHVWFGCDRRSGGGARKEKIQPAHDRGEGILLPGQ